MSKYKVGDIVKLRDDLDIGEEYGAVDFLCSMKTLKNKALRIDRIDTEDDECVVYEIDGWCISEEMIEGLWEECNQVKKDNDHTLDAWRYAVESKLSEQVSKLKLIDVLNMIAKGELKEGTKVGLRNNVYTFERHYWNDASLGLFRSNGKQSVFEDFCLSHILNDEVELIEPPCEHEWLDWETHRIGEGRIRRYRRCNKCGLEEETEDNHFADVGKMEKIEELDLFEFAQGTAIDYKIAFKLNEVINKVNAQTEVILAQRKDIDEIKEQLDY